MPCTSYLKNASPMIRECTVFNSEQVCSDLVCGAARRGVLLADLHARLEEEAVGQLLDVRLVHDRHVLAVVVARVLERERRHAHRLRARHDLQALDHSYEHQRVRLPAHRIFLRLMPLSL